MSENYTTADGEPLTDFDLHERYDDMLSECYGDVDIAGLTFDTADALKNLDPIAYRVGFDDWLDSELSGGTIIDRDDEANND